MHSLDRGKWLLHSHERVVNLARFLITRLEIAREFGGVGEKCGCEGNFTEWPLHRGNSGFMHLIKSPFPQV